MIHSHIKEVQKLSLIKIYDIYTAPKSVSGNTFSIEHTFEQNTFTIIQFSIPVRSIYRVIINSPYKIMLECTGETPKSATVTVHCNETSGIFSSSYIVEYTKQPNNITGSVLVPQYQQCNISIVFSNEAGSSKPFILPFGKVVCVYSLHYYSINRYISSVY